MAAPDGILSPWSRTPAADQRVLYLGCLWLACKHEARIQSDPICLRHRTGAGPVHADRGLGTGTLVICHHPAQADRACLCCRPWELPSCWRSPRSCLWKQPSACSGWWGMMRPGSCSRSAARTRNSRLGLPADSDSSKQDMLVLPWMHCVLRDSVGSLAPLGCLPDPVLRPGHCCGHPQQHLNINVEGTCSREGITTPT